MQTHVNSTFDEYALSPPTFALLRPFATMAAAYAIYGPEGLEVISGRIHALARVADREVTKAGFKVNEATTDTFSVDVSSKGMTV
jgi:glycine cleavage system pyridoxal-binding protein P